MHAAHHLIAANSKIKIWYFKVPAKREQVVHKGKDWEHHSKKSNVKNCQHEAWMNAITKGYTTGSPDCSDSKNMRTCTCHFHPSVVFQNSDGKHELKTGASPTMCLTKFSMENDNSKEEKSLPRIVGNIEDLQHTHNHENKNKDETLKIAMEATIVTHTRDSRIKKRRCDMLQFEEAKKVLC